MLAFRKCKFLAETSTCIPTIVTRHVSETLSIWTRTYEAKTIGNTTRMMTACRNPMIVFAQWKAQVRSVATRRLRHVGPYHPRQRRPRSPLVNQHETTRARSCLLKLFEFIIWLKMNL